MYQYINLILFPFITVIIFHMNFFSDDFNFSEASPFSQQKNKQKPILKAEPREQSPTSFMKKGKDNMNDDLDDIMNELLEKEQNKKKKTSQSPSKYKEQPKKNQKNIGFNQGYYSTQQLNKNFSGNQRQSNKSIFQDQLSEDNKSYKSGVTGRGGESVSGFEKLMPKIPDSQIPLLPSSSMRNMKPPLRRKEGKEPSVLGDQIVVSTKFHDPLTSSIPDMDIGNFPPMPRRQQSTLAKDTSLKRLQFNQPVKQKIIQKIVYVKQQQKQIKAQHQKELKIIKETYQRQIKLLQDNYDKQVEAHKQTRYKMMQQNEKNLQNQRNKWHKLQKQNIQRVKQLNQWQWNKKEKTYQLEISRLKDILESYSNFNKQQQKTTKYGFSQQELKFKEKQLERERAKIRQLQDSIRAKQRNLEQREFQFDRIKRREDDKIQAERKKIYQLQNEVKKQQMDIKRTLMMEKQTMASDLANAQLQVSKKKQQVRAQKQQLNLQRQMFQRQKKDMQEFNSKVLAGYRQQIKQLEQQKEKVYQLQIQLFKKIHTVELMATQQGKNLSADFQDKKIKKIKENNDQSNKLEDKLKSTKQRFAQMEEWTKKNESKSQHQNTSKVYLEKYLMGLNRGQRR